MIIGTRTLWPYGPGVKTEAGYVALPVNKLGGVGGTMWSKKPSFSNIWKKTVLLQTSGLAVNASSIPETYHAPKFDGQLPCSVYASGATIHDTCGKRSARTSSRKMSKRAVLHHDDDVLDVMDGAGLVIGRNRQSAGNACRKTHGCRSGGREFRKSRRFCAHAEFRSVDYLGGNRGRQLSRRALRWRDVLIAIV